MNQSLLMRNTFNMLSTLLSCPVTRAWPQGDAQTPSAAFRLKSCRRLEDGADEAVIGLILRADTPAMADALADEVLSGIGEYGYYPTAATDEVEEVTGFFLLSLELTVMLRGGSANACRFGVGVSPVKYLGGLYRVTQISAAAPVFRRSSLSGLVTGALRGRPGQPSYLISQAYIADDPAQTAIETAFLTGTPLPCEIWLSPLDKLSFTALVSGFSRSVLGFSCELTRID
jgi:hypothetical protein